MSMSNPGFIILLKDKIYASEHICCFILSIINPPENITHNNM